MFKLLIHISDRTQWQTAINNINNTLKALRTPYKIMVVANVNAIQGYLEPEIRTQLTAICSHNNHDHNVTFTACNNSLVGQNVSPEMLNPVDIDSKIEIVPVGIITIVEYQNQGYAYMKP